MSAEFTKGPWRLVESNDPYPCVYIMGDSDEHVLSEFGAKQLFSGDEDCDTEEYGELEIAMLDMLDEPIEERSANATLICAAPILYEALEALLREARRVNWASHFNGDVGVMEIAEDALRQARGES